MNPIQPDRCFRCGGPIGPTATRCPVCGADLTMPVAQPPPVQPAVVGMRLSGRPLQEMRRDRRRRSAILALTAAAGLLLIAGLGYAGYRMLSVPVPTATPVPPAAPSGPMPLTLEGVSIPDPSRADPTDLLPAVRRRMVETEGDYRLVEIVATHARGAVVDMNAPGAQISYRYLVERQDPRAARAEVSRERIDLLLSARGPTFQRSRSPGGDDPVPDPPTCVWSAAWRAAIAVGLPTNLEADARYGRRQKSDKSTWLFTVSEKPDVRIEIDGTTCAIRSR